MAKKVLLKNPDGETIYPATKLELVRGAYIDYSLEEKQTGAKWIDGSPIFKQTFYLASTGTRRKIPFGVNENIREVVGIEGVLYSVSGGYYISANEYFRSTALISVNVANITGVVTSSVQRQITNNSPLWVTVYFIK